MPHCLHCLLLLLPPHWFFLSGPFAGLLDFRFVYTTHFRRSHGSVFFSTAFIPPCRSGFHCLFMRWTPMRTCTHCFVWFSHYWMVLLLVTCQFTRSPLLVSLLRRTAAFLAPGADAALPRCAPAAATTFSARTTVPLPACFTHLPTCLGSRAAYHHMLTAHARLLLDLPRRLTPPPRVTLDYTAPADYCGTTAFLIAPRAPPYPVLPAPTLTPLISTWLQLPFWL